AALQRLKGWGKDPIAATLGLSAMFGPVTFDYWDGDIPVGRDEPDAWVQVVAVNQDQPLALDSAVRTPDGWSTVGDLSVGDVVFDERGKARPVERVTPVLHGLPCYRLTFD